jgi:hypothetical protein
MSVSSTGGVALGLLLNSIASKWHLPMAIANGHH